MGGARCVVGGCSNKRSERVSLHQFPKDTNMRQKWVRAIKCTGTNISRVDWKVLSYSKSFQAQLVCSDYLLHIQECKKRVETSSSRGAFRKCELERASIYFFDVKFFDNSSYNKFCS
jgi:hypothetical protein